MKKRHQYKFTCCFNVQGRKTSSKGQLIPKGLFILKSSSNNQSIIFLYSKIHDMVANSKQHHLGQLLEKKLISKEFISFFVCFWSANSAQSSHNNVNIYYIFYLRSFIHFFFCPLPMKKDTNINSHAVFMFKIEKPFLKIT